MEPRQQCWRDEAPLQLVPGEAETAGSDFMEDYRKTFQDDFNRFDPWFLPEHELDQQLPSWAGGSYLAELEGFEKATPFCPSFGLKGFPEYTKTLVELTEASPGPDYMEQCNSASRMVLQPNNVPTSSEGVSCLPPAPQSWLSLCPISPEQASPAEPLPEGQLQQQKEVPWTTTLANAIRQSGARERKTRLVEAPPIMSLEIGQGMVPSSCGVFYWSSFKTALVKPSSAGQGMTGSSNSVTHMRWPGAGANGRISPA